MIGITGLSAVLSRPIEGLANLDTVRVAQNLRGHKTMSPSSQYANQAVALLNPSPVGLGMVCISGPTGSLVEAFDKAWRLSGDGRLVGPGFARSRSKRIHPFTLMRSLQNQVPATLSMEFGIHGPCLNALEGATAPAVLLPNILAMLNQCEKVLLVMAGAGFRGEEAAKHQAVAPESEGVEGAVCMLLSKGEGPLGFLAPSPETTPSDAHRDGPFSLFRGLVFQAGLAVLRALAGKESSVLVPLTEFNGHQAFLQWRRTWPM